jgi:hypothetical protein
MGKNRRAPRSQGKQEVMKIQKNTPRRSLTIPTILAFVMAALFVYVRLTLADTIPFGQKEIAFVKRILDVVAGVFALTGAVVWFIDVRRQGK